MSLCYGRHFLSMKKIRESNLADVFFFSCTVRNENVSINDKSSSFNKAKSSFPEKTDGNRCLYLLCIIRSLETYGAKTDFGNKLVCPSYHEETSHVAFLPLEVAAPKASLVSIHLEHA